jgi:hypothetical protein
LLPMGPARTATAALTRCCSLGAAHQAGATSRGSSSSSSPPVARGSLRAHAWRVIAVCRHRASRRCLAVCGAQGSCPPLPLSSGSGPLLCAAHVGRVVHDGSDVKQCFMEMCKVGRVRKTEHRCGTSAAVRAAGAREPLYFTVKSITPIDLNSCWRLEVWGSGGR